MDIVIVTKERPVYLAATLASLAACKLPPRSHLVLSFDQEEVTPSISNIMSLMRSVLLVDVTSHRGLSVANARASILKQLRSEYVLMLDDDVVFSSPIGILNLIATINRLTYLNENTLAVGYPHIDVNSGRGWEDYNGAKVYSSFRAFPFPVFQLNHHCFASTMAVAYSNTNAIWHLPTLIRYGVLDFWEEYPVGLRGYDLVGSARAVEAGAWCYTSSLGIMWHLGVEPETHFTEGLDYPISSQVVDKITGYNTRGDHV